MRISIFLFKTNTEFLWIYLNVLQYFASWAHPKVLHFLTIGVQRLITSHFNIFLRVVCIHCHHNRFLSIVTKEVVKTFSKEEQSALLSFQSAANGHWPEIKQLEEKEGTKTNEKIYSILTFFQKNTPFLLISSFAVQWPVL